MQRLECYGRSEYAGRAIAGDKERYGQASVVNMVCLLCSVAAYWRMLLSVVNSGE